MPGARLIVLVEHEQGDDAELVVSRGLPQLGKKTTGPRNLPRLDPADSVRWVVRARPGRQELSALLPEAWHVQSGQRLALDVYGGSQLVVRALAVVPASSELPPPPPEAWETPADEGAGGTD